MQFEWKGVFPAITTQFTADDQLDLQMFEKNLYAQLEAGIHGVILGGTLGESSTLTREEKEILIRFTKEKVAGRIPVILNIAEGATKAAVNEAQWAEQLGVDGLMLLPPMRYKADDRETVQFFSTVARSVSLPILIYNNPVDYRIMVTPDMFAQLTDCANIQAVKDSTRDVSNVTRMINRFGNRYRILCGVDPIAMESLLMGASGWVGGLVNAFPRETVLLYHLVQSRQIDKALQVHRWFLPLLELDLSPKLVQYIKLAASITGIGAEYVRPPRLPLVGEERQQILSLIQKAMTAEPAWMRDLQVLQETAAALHS
ncbi:dihydrodipicolinate synthase family protein [Thermoflavifilum thermophilum]|nr:dihydrodipicolinate synthase family protein [Thermoflavifilum thermophilum]